MKPIGSLLTPLAAHARRAAAVAPAAGIAPVEGAAEERQLAFLARLLIQATMPHTDPGARVVHRRINGAFKLSIEGKAEVGLPFGCYPRLIFVWLNTEVVRTGSRRVELGESLGAFMRAVGVPHSTGAKGTARAFSDQLRRMLTARFTFTVGQEAGGVCGTDEVDTLVTSRRVLWWDPRKPDEPVLFGSYVELTNELFQVMRAGPVPLDMRALRALKRSPLGLDLYSWASGRLSYAREPVTVAWDSLHAQFGSEYADTSEFRRQAMAQLRRIAALWQGFRFEAPRGRLVLHPSPPHVERVSAWQSAVGGR
jgi:hypothetical protein